MLLIYHRVLMPGGTIPNMAKSPYLLVAFSAVKRVCHKLRQCILLFLGVFSAHAIAVAQVSTSPGQTKGEFAARSPAERAADVVNVKDFGAKGDGVTDDSAALNGAMAYVRARRSVGNGQPGITGQAYTAKLVIPQGRYRVVSSLNWTNLVSLTVEIDCQGCVIDGQTRGAPLIDALGSRWLRVNGLTIWGNDSLTPSIGLQIGRTTGASADDHHFKDLTLSGFFSFAALYDFAAETTSFDHLLVWNQSPSPSAFGGVLDGINHWHAASAFTVVTAPVDTLQSFNETLFVNPSIMTTNGAGAPLWIAGTSRARFITGYVANTRTACGTVLYAPGGWPITQLAMDVHYESSALRDVFCIDGPAGTKQAAIRGLSYTDNYPEASNSLFEASANIAGVTMRDTDIHIDNFYSATAKVFDDPRLWTVTGRYAEISGNHWNLPSSKFQGFTDLAGQVSITSANINVGHKNLSALSANANDEFNIGGAITALAIDDIPSATLNGNLAALGQLHMVPTTPAMSSALCRAGQIAADAQFIYVCVATNSWKRAALAPW